MRVTLSDWRFAAPLLLILIVYLFAAWNLWWIDNHNDFGEYFSRAEQWSKGRFVWTGGSDKLLSLIELAPSILFPHDLFWSYFLTKIILILLLFVSVWCFVTSDAPMLPPRRSRLLASVLFLAHPVFLLSTVTVDESILLAIAVLLIFSFYHRRHIAVPLAIVSLYSRPEALLIVPTFAAIGCFAKDEHRRDLLGTAAIVALLCVGVKVVEIRLVGTTQEFDLAAGDTPHSFTQLLINGVLAPAIPLRIAAEVFRNVFVWVLFLVGVVLTCCRRECLAFFAMLLSHAVLVAGLFWSLGLSLTEKFPTTFAHLSWFSASFQVDLANDQLMAPRYYLCAYPALAVIFVVGIEAIVRSVFRNSQSVLAAVLALALSATTFAPGYGHLLLSGRFGYPKSVKPLNIAAMELRREALPDDAAVLFDGICDATRGTLLTEFSVYSGILPKYARVCAGSEAFALIAGKERIIKAEAIETLSPTGQVAVMDFAVDADRTAQLVESGAMRRIFALEPEALRDAGVKAIVSTRGDLADQDFRLIRSIDGVFLYRTE